MPEIIRDSNPNPDEELDIFLRKNFNHFAGMVGMGAFGIAIEPIVKGLTTQDISRMNEYFFKNGISIDTLFLHDQLTDYIFTAGSVLTVNAFVEAVILDKMPDEGRWGIKKESWKKGSLAISSGILLGGGLIKEYADVITIHGISTLNGLNGISLKDIDQKDMIFYAAGIFAGIVAGQIWNELEKKKAVEIDPQA